MKLEYQLFVITCFKWYDIVGGYSINGPGIKKNLRICSQNYCFCVGGIHQVLWTRKGQLRGLLINFAKFKGTYFSVGFLAV